MHGLSQLAVVFAALVALLDSATPIVSIHTHDDRPGLRDLALLPEQSLVLLYGGDRPQIRHLDQYGDEIRMIDIGARIICCDRFFIRDGEACYSAFGVGNDGPAAIMGCGTAMHRTRSVTLRRVPARWFAIDSEPPRGLIYQVDQDDAVVTEVSADGHVREWTHPAGGNPTLLSRGGADSILIGDEYLVASVVPRFGENTGRVVLRYYGVNGETRERQTTVVASHVKLDSIEDEVYLLAVTESRQIVLSIGTSEEIGRDWITISSPNALRSAEPTTTQAGGQLVAGWYEQLANGDVTIRATTLLDGMPRPAISIGDPINARGLPPGSLSIRPGEGDTVVFVSNLNGLLGYELALVDMELALQLRVYRDALAVIANRLLFPTSNSVAKSYTTRQP